MCDGFSQGTTDDCTFLLSHRRRIRPSMSPTDVQQSATGRDGLDRSAYRLPPKNPETMYPELELPWRLSRMKVTLQPRKPEL